MRAKRPVSMTIMVKLPEIAGKEANEDESGWGKIAGRIVDEWVMEREKRGD